jgi:hypothetical protein
MHFKIVRKSPSLLEVPENNLSSTACVPVKPPTLFLFIENFIPKVDLKVRKYLVS